MTQFIVLRLTCCSFKFVLVVRSLIDDPTSKVSKRNPVVQLPKYPNEIQFPKHPNEARRSLVRRPGLVNETKVFTCVVTVFQTNQTLGRVRARCF